MSADNSICVGALNGKYRVAECVSDWWDYTTCQETDPRYIAWATETFKDSKEYDTLQDALNFAHSELSKAERRGQYIEYDITILARPY